MNGLKYHVASFYRFFPIARDLLAVRKLAIENLAARYDVCGLVILADEGINGTVAATDEHLFSFFEGLSLLLGVADWNQKHSFCREAPYPRFRVRIRREIVTTAVQQEEPSPAPLDDSATRHLTPAEWQQVLDSDPSAVVLDVRNDYEVEVGKFKGALDFGMANFNEFPAEVKKAGWAREQKILMYCTGGIRCEKALLEMEKQGYHNVYQLSGGILRYLEQFPERSFEGECFVFDRRVALDQHLFPTKSWALCRHCGQPGRSSITCSQCHGPGVLCQRCASEQKTTCCPDCSYRQAQAIERTERERRRQLRVQGVAEAPRSM